MRDRLLAEDVLARLRRLDDEVRMSIGGGADQRQPRFPDSPGSLRLESATVGIPQRAANACAASRLTSAMHSRVRASGQTKRQRFGMDSSRSGRRR